ncbi:hypothetical protein [Nocardia thraciensis]
MSARGTGGPYDPEQLLSEFDRYDRDVDIVSAYHWLFTETNLRSTVEHFERYPSIVAPDGNIATPDFTVLFNDGSGIAAEIANLALPDTSVEKLCKQLGRYSTLQRLPARRRKQKDISVLDVLYLSPIETADDAVRRIFSERLENPNHPFKPIRKPVVVQFARTPQRYVFQLWPDSDAVGSLYIGDRNPNYSEFRSFKIEPYRFDHNKVKYAFMNDTVAPLYMATRLWANVFPAAYSVGSDVEFETTTAEIVGILRSHYSLGRGRADDVRAAMSILVAAGLATVVSNDKNQWRVNRRSLRKKSEGIHRVILDRISKAAEDKSAKRRALRRSIANDREQGVLF